MSTAISCTDFGDLAFTQSTDSNSQVSKNNEEFHNIVSDIVFKNIITFNPGFNPNTTKYYTSTLHEKVSVTVSVNMPNVLLKASINGQEFVLLPNTEYDELILNNGSNICIISAAVENVTLYYTIDILKHTFIQTGLFGQYGTIDGQCNYPRGIAIRNNEILVVDSNNDRIQIFTSEGAYKGKFGILGAGNGYEMKNPYGITTNSSGEIFITDTNNHRIKRFDHNNVFVQQWGSKGNNTGQFNFPIGIACDKYNNVYVADTYNNRIQKFDPNGNFLHAWGTKGNSWGQFNYPYGIVVDEDDFVYVADTYNNRIQKFTNSGEYITQWGIYGSSKGQFKYPYGIITAGNYIFVTEYNGHRVQVFTKSGEYVTSFGSYGINDNQLKNPFGIAVDANSNVYIVEEQLHRIKMFKFH